MVVTGLLAGLILPLIPTGSADARVADSPTAGSTVAASAVSSSGSRGAALGVAAAPVPRVRWRSCGKPLLCASAAVPLDWSRPRAGSISLSLVKLPASLRRGRIGTIFVNPGGPGASGADMMRADPTFLPASVRARFDVIGFDPRFVAASRPAASCLYDEAYLQFVSDQPAFPVGDTQEAAFLTAQSTYAQACRGHSSLRYASTASVARDLELLRVAVGDPQLTFVGYSYGSYLGQVYAQLYPSKVRAMVLDGVIDAQQWVSGSGDEWRSSPFSVRIGSAAGSSAALGEFFRLCRVAGRTRCQLAAQGNPAATYRWLADALLAAPIPLGDGVDLDYATLIGATASVLYSPQYWEVFAAELESLYVEILRAADPAAAGAASAALNAGRTPAPALRAATAAARLKVSSPGARLRAAARSVQSRTASAGGLPVMPALTGALSGTGAGAVAGTVAGHLTARPFERPLPTRPDPLPPIVPADNEFASFAAVTCSDSRNPDDAARWVESARRQDESYPYFGRAWAWSGAQCLSWTLRDPNAYTGRFGARTANPILVIGTTFDPATPYRGAVATARRFPGARLFTVHGYGHTSAAVPNACVDRATAYYLLTRKPPRPGAYCRQDPVAFR